MRTALLLGSALALPKSDSYAIRMDRPHAFSNEMTFQQVQIQPGSPRQLAVANGTSAFQFQFSCSNSTVGVELCERARAGFERVGQRISQVLDISQPLIVQAKFYSFCKEKQTTTGSLNCKKEDNTIGRASTAAYFGAKSASDPQVYLYPQPLLKQFNTQQVIYAPYDIYAEFNADHSFYFADSGIPITVNQTDFDFVVAHEMTHGLGFDSSFVDLNLVLQQDVGAASYLAPLPYVQGTNLQSATASIYSPMFPFDAFVYGGNGDSLASIGATIRKFKQNAVPFLKFLSEFRRSGEPYNAAIKAKNLLESATLQFKSPKGTVSLYSPSEFQQGSSTAHCNPSLSSTEDFLMIPAIEPLLGQSLDQITQRQSGGQLYGKGLINVLSSIGWPIKGDPTRITLTLVATSDLNGALSSSISTTLVLLAAIMFII